MAQRRLSAQEGVTQPREERMVPPADITSDKPAPTWIPLMTGMGMASANQRRRPVMLKIKMQRPTKMPAAAMVPLLNDRAMATAAMAFIGWTGSGIPKNRPVRMLKTPEKIRVLDNETVSLIARAMAIGRKVPRSPSEPEISET